VVGTPASKTGSLVVVKVTAKHKLELPWSRLNIDGSNT